MIIIKDSFVLIFCTNFGTYFPDLFNIFFTFLLNKFMEVFQLSKSINDATWYNLFYLIWSCIPADCGGDVVQAVGQRPQSSGPGSSGREWGHPLCSRPNLQCLHRTWCSLHGHLSIPEHCLLSSSEGWSACMTDLLKENRSIVQAVHSRI